MLSKNFFEYGSKELNQDAFLSWLFANYDNEDYEDVRDAAKIMINRLTESNFDSITVKSVENQKKNIDIVVFF